MSGFDGDFEGYDWYIRIRDEFSATVEKLKAELADTQQKFAALSAENKKLAAASKKASQSVRDMARAQEQSATAAERTSRATRKRAGMLTAEEAALERLVKIEREIAIEREVERQAAELGLDVSKRIVRQLSVEEEAQRRVAKAKRDLAVKAREAELREKEGIGVKKKVIRKLTEEEEAEKRLAEAKRRRRIEEIQANLAAQQGLLPNGKPIPPPDTRSRAEILAGKAQAEFAAEKDRLEVQRLRDQLRATSPEYARLKERARAAAAEVRAINRAFAVQEGRVNRVSFTFRRLFGILAAFAAARATIQGFFGLIKESINFNSSIEQSRLGIAALITAVSTVRDEFGNVVDVSRALPEALSIAQGLIQQLRIDATRTVATFDQLAETLQVAIAPGITAGFDLNQIRQFTVQISQAAAALGLAQNQLAEEIRSILEGTIQRRTTRIATALGITNEDIRRWRQAGTLFDELNARFVAFSRAGNAAAETFQGTLTNTLDALRLVIGEGGQDLFGTLKSILNGFREALVDPVDLGLRPEAVRVAEAFLSAVTRAAQRAKELQQNLGFEDALAVASALGDTLSIAVDIIAGIVQGAINGFRNVQGIVRAVVDTLGDIFGFDIDTTSLRDVVALVTQISVTLIGAQAALFPIRTTFDLILKPVTGIASAIRTSSFFMQRLSIYANRVGIALLPLTGKVLLIGAAIVAGALALREWLSYLTDTDLKFESIVNIVAVVLPKAVTYFIDFLRVSLGGFIGLFELIGVSIYKLVTDYFSVPFVEAFERIETGLRELFGISSDLFSGIARDLRAQSKAAAENLNNIILGFEQRKRDVEKSARDLQRALQTDGGSTTGEAQNIADVAARNDAARTFGEFISDGIREAFQGLNNILGLEDFGLGQAIDQATSLSDVIDRIPGAISQSNEQLRVAGETLQRLEDDARDVGAALTVALTQGGSGIGGNIDQAINQVVQTRIQAEKDGLDLDNKRLSAKQRLEALERRLLQIGRTSAQQGENINRRVTEAVQIAQLRAGVENEITSQKIQLAQNEERLATRLLNLSQDEIQALESQNARIRENIRAREQEISFLNQSLDALGSAGLDAGQVAVVRELVGEAIGTLGQIQAASDEIRTIDDSRLKLNEQINNLLAKRLQLQNVQGAQAFNELAVENQLAIAKSRILAIAAEENDQNLRAFASAAFRVGELQNEIGFLEQRNQAARDFVRAQEAAGLSGDALRELEIAVGRQIVENTQKQSILNNELREAIALRDRARQELEGTFDEGAAAGFRRFAEEYEGSFKAALNATKSAIDSTASFLSGAIIDALDPSTKVDPRQLFGNFFRQIANIYLEEMIRAYIAAALTKETIDGPQQVTEAVDAATQAAATVQAATFSQQALAAGGAAVETGMITGATTATQILAGGATTTSTIVAGGASIGATTLAGGATIGATEVAGACTTGGAALAAGGAAAGTAIEAASISLIAALGPIAAALAVVGGIVAISRSQGGPVPRRSDLPRRSGRSIGPHSRRGVQGFSRGGGPRRPSWVSPRDTIPAWLSPGEFVHPPESVGYYGPRIMEAIRRRLIDPGALNALLSPISVSSPRAPTKASYAAGGLVLSEQRQDARATSRDPAEATPREVLVTSGRNFDRLVAGGKSAQLRAIRDNRSAYRAALGLGRGDR